MNEHNGSRFAHITKAHPCFNEKVHDKVGRAHVPVAPKCNIYKFRKNSFKKRWRNYLGNR